MSTNIRYLSQMTKLLFWTSVFLLSWPGCAAALSLQVPAGFHVGLWAKVPNARSLALGGDGTVFVGTRRDGRVFALRDRDGDGRADKRWTLMQGRNMPNGVAFRNGALYVAESGAVWRLDGIEQQLQSPPEPVLVRRLTAYDHHGWRYIAFGPDDRLYVSLGAPCNICDPGPFGAIWSMRPDGSDFRPYARGVRNSVGLTFHPQTGELWFTDNGRDWLGDDLPPDELNHAPQPGMHFGYPYCHGGDIPDPDFGQQRACREFTPPVQRLGPHVASLGLRFYDGTQFPAGFRGQLLLAEHGSWNRSTPIGYRVSLVRLEAGRAVSYRPFVSGWLDADGGVHGRPVDLLVLPDGSVLISDDAAGRIYRLSYRGDGS
jgi:glucose/arabinose dehydrogenase